MMKQLIFMDIDGTLCDTAGEVPLSANRAIQQAKSQGHDFYICTGRSKPELIPSILDIGFQGIIGAGGGYIEIAGEVVEHLRLPKPAVLEIIAYFQQHNIGYYLESNDGLFGSENCVPSIINQVTAGLVEESPAYQEAIREFDWFYDLLKETKGIELDYGNVNKISFISNGHPFIEVAETFGDDFQMYRTTVPQFGSQSGEIAVKGINKQTAINKVLALTKHPQGQTMAYGDGNNDIAMFQAVNYKVAMTNGTPELKALADEITAIAEENGIANSLLRNGLLEKEIF